MKLMPPTQCMKSLEADYAHMQNMIFGEKIPFDKLMAAIQQLEVEINQFSA